MGIILRNIHKSSGRPDCELCLDDVLKHGLTLSKDCAILEVEQNNNARKRLVKGFREMEQMCKEIKRRLETDIRAEIIEDMNKRKHPNPKGNPSSMPWMDK